MWRKGRGKILTKFMFTQIKTNIYKLDPYNLVLKLEHANSIGDWRLFWTSVQSESMLSVLLLSRMIYGYSLALVLLMNK